MDQDQREVYNKASLNTANDLREIAHSIAASKLSRLSLPEVDEAVHLVARMVPAGNIPGMILNGLVHINERTPNPDIVERDVNLLFDSVEQMLDRALYGALLVGPAAVLWSYQHLVRLAGKDPDSAFPDGTWQFYVEYALREDTARHTNETHGFDTLLNNYNIQLPAADRMAAWILAVAHVIADYPALLANEWRERVYIRILQEASGNTGDARIGRAWASQRPYTRTEGTAANETYAQYRKRRFDDFLQPYLDELTEDQRRKWLTAVQAAKIEELPRYQDQLSILARLVPEEHRERRQPLTLDKINIAIVYQGQYFLVPLCTQGTTRLQSFEAFRRQITAIHALPMRRRTANLIPLARLQRRELMDIRGYFNTELAVELEMLSHAPIILNFDRADVNETLSQIRQAERGVGDHALTIFDTGRTFVFDQSHIFFDGAWGAALAEIITNSAVEWALYLAQLPPEPPHSQVPYQLSAIYSPEDQKRIQNAQQVAPEISAENDQIDLGQLLKLRKLFKERSDLLQLTVNDLLVLYRAIHAVEYTPNEALLNRLRILKASPQTKTAASVAQKVLNAAPDSPSILIPVDASQNHPRERLYPMNFQVPLNELDLRNRHQTVLAALDAYAAAGSGRDDAFTQFNRLQREYLATLAGFGQVLYRAKIIANTGESLSSEVLKLLGHMHPALQQLLDGIPGRFDLLNDIIKGREIMSNVGVVAPSSTLTRFITAKDDNEKKELGWGFITDAEGVMRVSLRDFRPHVGALAVIGEQDLSQAITQHYLDTYVEGFNIYIKQLRRITSASSKS